MKIVIFVLVCFAIFFAVNRLYALYCNQLLKKTYFALELKNLKDAKKYAKRIIKTALKAHGYEVLGEISQAEEDHLCAIEYFALALKYDATFKLALLGISESYKKLGQLNDAEAFLNKASELYPEDEMILHYKKCFRG